MEKLNTTINFIRICPIGDTLHLCLVPFYLYWAKFSLYCAFSLTLSNVIYPKLCLFIQPPFHYRYVC